MTSRMIIRLWGAVWMLAAGGAAAEAPPSLGLPADCALGTSCWIMNYVDDNPGGRPRDFRCHGRTYGGHDGTDLAVADWKTMAAGVAVVAAAPGVVAAVRDGEPEGGFAAGDKGSVKGKECGNRVAIHHGGGWLTDYCHLRRGSVAVKPGEVVARGQALGQVGMSGMTQFPHVHMSVRRRETVIDPFTGHAAAEGCAAGDGALPGGLWRDGVFYQPMSLYAAGFADHLPADDEIRHDAGSPAQLNASAAALVLWSAVFGPGQGDRLTLTITGPDGAVVASHGATQDRDQAWASRSLGKRSPPGGWPAGTYVGTVTLERPGQPVQSRAVRVEMR